MISEFHQHPDGLIIIRTDTGTYIDTSANFQVDFGQLLPLMPAGADELVYVQNARNCYMGGGNTIAGGPLQWDFGDAAIAALDSLLKAQNVRAQAAAVAFQKAADAAQAARFPTIISDRQFFQQLAVQSVITQDEALAAVRTGTVPAALQTYINANLTGSDLFAANMLLSGAVSFYRDHPLVQAVGTGMGWTSQQMDDLWRAASQL